MHTAHAAGARLFIEIGPGTTFLSLGRNIFDNVDTSSSWLPSLNRSAAEQVSQSLAELYSRWVNINLGVYTSSMSGAGRIPIPTYPFQHQRYWLAAPPRRPLYNGSLPWISVCGRHESRSPPWLGGCMDTHVTVDARRVSCCDCLWDGLSTKMERG